MSTQHREEISRRLRPVRPPRIVDGVFEKGQLDIMLDLIRRHGPWNLILKHHFRSLEELLATMSGGRPIDPNVSLDSFLTPTFRGFFASGGVCLHPEAEPIFYEPPLHGLGAPVLGRALLPARKDPFQRERSRLERRSRPHRLAALPRPRDSRTRRHGCSA